MAKPEEFERYVYGGNYDRKFYSDDTDAQIDKSREHLTKWNDEIKEQMDKSIRESQAAARRQ